MIPAVQESLVVGPMASALPFEPSSTAFCLGKHHYTDHQIVQSIIKKRAFELTSLSLPTTVDFQYSGRLIYSCLRYIVCLTEVIKHAYPYHGFEREISGRVQVE